ncbi:hypothetical protein AAULR_26166, partial [Lacticaseibacillus rhamnosus MTCC 5462]
VNFLLGSHISLLSQWIAILTLATTILFWVKEHQGLLFEPDQVAKPVTRILLDDGRSIEDDRGLLPLTLWLINPSDHDI